MTNIFYLCTRLTYWYAEFIHEKGLVPRCVWSVLHTIEVSETTFEETVGNSPFYRHFKPIKTL